MEEDKHSESHDDDDDEDHNDHHEAPTIRTTANELRKREVRTLPSATTA